MNNQKVITQTIDRFNSNKPNDVGIIDKNFYSKVIDHRNIYYYFAVIERVVKDIVAKEQTIDAEKLEVNKCIDYINQKYGDLIAPNYITFLKECFKKGGVRDKQFEIRPTKIAQKDVQILVISSIYLLNIHNVSMKKIANKTK